MVELGNEGARELGSQGPRRHLAQQYDMPPDAFAKPSSTGCGTGEPVYDSLHCYVRGGLAKNTATRVQPKADPGPPARQHVGAGWGNVYDWCRRRPGAGSSTSPSSSRPHKVDALGHGEVRRTLFHLARLRAAAADFWERSLFTQPRDRDVVCHASAWDVDYGDDLRIKMCIEITARTS